MVRWRIVVGTNDEVLDVAVVGGGVAGAYAAWRLLCDRGGASGPPPKVAVFEGSDRLGGRLLSLKPPGMDKLVCELGGMYFGNIHPMVCALSKRLGLEMQDLPLASFDLFYLRRIAMRGMTNWVPYNFAPNEQSCPPMQLLPNALEKLIPGVTRLTGKTLEEKLRTALVDGQHIADWGFWNLLYLAMSSEAFAYSRDSTSEDYFFVNWNAADSIRAMQNFSCATKVYHLADGYDALPFTMCGEVEKAGGKVLLRHRLKSFERVDGGIRLHLVKNSTGWGPTGGGEPITVVAKHLVLAMPKRSLELLDQTGPLLGDARVQKMIGSVTPIPMFKMYSCYSSPWWKELGFKSQGVGITDMPLRTCLYWGTESEQAGANPDNHNSLLLTSLDDLMQSSFWAGLREPHHEESFLAARGTTLASAALFGHPGSPEWQQFSDCTSDRIVTEAQAQLSEMHGIKVPDPYAAASMNWNRDPFGGSTSFWNIHVRSEDLTLRMTQPVDGLPVYVCGDTYSQAQGWVEGSLESTELMLKERFKLPPPRWLQTSEST